MNVRYPSGRIGYIMTSMICPKNFECAKEEFKNLCKEKDIELDLFLDCKKEKSTDCNFALPFGSSNLCQCPLRVHLGKTLGL